MRRKRRRLRPVSLILAAGVGLSACANNPQSADYSGLTQDQRTLRTEASQFNQTVGVPAVLGALAGAALGGILCRNKDKAACAGGGAAAGGLLGGGAGYLVAKENTQAAGREETLRTRIAAARQEVERFDRVIAATNGVIAEHKKEIAALKAEQQKRQGVLVNYRQETASLRGDITALQENIDGIGKIIAVTTGEIEKLGGVERASLAAERDKLLIQQETLHRRLATLLGLEEAVPTA